MPRESGAPTGQAGAKKVSGAGGAGFGFLTVADYLLEKREFCNKLQ